MVRLYVIVLFIFACIPGFTQPTVVPLGKAVLDTSVLGKFPFILASAKISNDGRYISYLVKEQPAGGSTLVLQSTETDWKRELVNPLADGWFVDNRLYAYLAKDTMVCWKLGEQPSADTFISGVASCRQPKTADWMAWQLKGAGGELVVRNYKNSREWHFSGITDYAFEENGRALLLKTREKEKNGLKWFDLQDTVTTTIWTDEASTAGKYNFDKTGEQLAFLAETKKGNRATYALWYYRTGMEKAMLRADNQNRGIDSGLTIADNEPGFSRNRQYIYFRLAPQPNNQKAPANAVKVTIWSYRDSIIQSMQTNGAVTYRASIGVDKGTIVRLEYADEMVEEFSPLDYVVVRDRQSVKEYWWPTYWQQKRWLVSLKDGARRQLPLKRTALFFSPQGRYTAYYDLQKRNYYSYDLASGRAKNLSAAVPYPLYDEQRAKERPLDVVSIHDIVGWLADESGLLVYDQYDIWHLDPLGVHPPVNLTNGYGRRHGIQLRLLNRDLYRTDLDKGRTLILNAVNEKNQHMGYYRLTLGKKGDPEQLVMEACTWGGTAYGGMDPVKAYSTNKWLVSRQTASEAPDLYVTSDFTHFKRLTHLQPQEGYNWLTAELLSWKRPDGKLNQGVLYKPGNFDPSKKYPVIFYYYERLSQDVFVYKRPLFSSGPINIPWFVSHGYLVCTPDIYYTPGKTGQSVMQSVVSAARYLSTFSFVDAKRMGLQGHSFGGYETNYLISHTHLFAAAAEAAGTSDCVSEYGAIRGEPGRENQINQVIIYENGQYRMGATLWLKPEAYIENSPIFKAMDVTTPLLMMHNKEDGNVRWGQGMEWYAGLRRLGKKVWMLEYEGEGHSVGGRNAVDYTLRLMQFFDHYLKGTPPPKWMTKGIPARLKGVETGYELDTNAQKP